MSSGPAPQSPEEPAREAEAPAEAGRRELGARDRLLTLALAVLLALGIRACAIEPFRIPSGSMYPTLLIGDHLFVNKFVYGIRIPFTDLRLPGLREPERGEVVVFSVAKAGDRTHPADRRPGLPREEFVKRIVGLPGDRIAFERDTLLVNGAPLEVRDLGETFTDERGGRLAVHEVILPGRRYRILDDPHSPGPRRRALTVEPGRYFVMGDNRDHSQDSRVWGTVRLADIKGPAFVLYWSWDFAGSWASLLNPLSVWELLTEKMRWERVGEAIR